MQSHLSSSSYSQTTIFDYIAQEALDGLLYPAFKKVFESVFSGFRILPKCDETYLLGSVIVQYYYLRKYGGSLSECLYNLKRIGLNEEPMSKQQILLSLATVSLVPYIKRKIENYVDELAYYEDYLTKKDKVILNTQRCINVLYTGAKFMQLLKFLLGSSQAQSPLLRILKLKLVMCREEDSGYLMGHLRRVFEILAFLLQSVQWTQSNKPSTSLTTYLPVSEAYSDVTTKKGCPICNEKQTAPTALSVSGFVFCFQCIQPYLAQYNECPVTGLPCNLMDLVRISGY